MNLRKLDHFPYHQAKFQTKHIFCTHKLQTGKTGFCCSCCWTGNLGCGPKFPQDRFFHPACKTHFFLLTEICLGRTFLLLFDSSHPCTPAQSVNHGQMHCHSCIYIFNIIHDLQPVQSTSSLNRLETQQSTSTIST
jgi:hypothetical protein